MGRNMDFRHVPDWSIFFCGIINISAWQRMKRGKSNVDRIGRNEKLRKMRSGPGVSCREDTTHLQGSAQKVSGGQPMDPTPACHYHPVGTAAPELSGIVRRTRSSLRLKELVK